MDMITMISVSIVNVTSYTGLELLRLLAQHPHFSVRSATARSAVGKRLGEIFPQLRLQPNKRDTLQAGINPQLVISEDPAQTDLAFVCLPHAAASEPIVTPPYRCIKAVDLSPAFPLPAFTQYTEPHHQPPPSPAFLEPALP